MVDELPMRRALVTGATGFVGSRLLRALVTSGVKVAACTGLPRPEKEVRWVTLDLLEPPQPDAHVGVDVVFHLAARATPSPHPKKTSGCSRE